MDPDEEKNAGLFADVLEYREALALLKDYGLGFDITFARFWHGREIMPLFKVTITKLPIEQGGLLLWVAQQSNESFLKAVRLAVRAAELESAAYYAKLKASVEAGPQNVSAGWPKYLQATLNEELKKAGLTPGVPCVPAPQVEEGS